MWTATFSSNIQDTTGDCKTTAVYSNGAISITESYTDASASTIKATVNNRLSQLQAAEDFVTANPTNSQPFTNLK